MKLPNTGNPYQAKDQKKADKATQFIGIGCVGSSTCKYANGLPADIVNTGEYTKDDRIFISINGMRNGRCPVVNIQDLVKAGAEAGASFITDATYDRNRSYNIGEREVADLLTWLGYTESQPGYWTK